MENKVMHKETGFYKNSKVIMIGIIIAVILLTVGITQLTKAQKNENYAVQGSLKFEETDLNSKIPGNIEAVLVEEGDRVKTGDPLIIIASDSLQAKKLQAEGALAAAQAVYQKAQNGARDQEVIQAKTAAELYEKTYNRVKELYEQGAVTENSYDQVHAQYIAAQETYSMALEGARSEDILAAHAMVLQAEGAVAEVESYLVDCTIKAPMDGVVANINVTTGELVSSGMPLASVTDKEDPWVEVNVMENYLNYIKEGGMVKVVFAAYPEETLEGTISEIKQQPDFATKRATSNNDDFDVLSFGVKIKLKDTERDLYPGMTVMVDFGEKPVN